MIDWNSRKPLSINQDAHSHIDGRRTEFGIGVRFVTEPEAEPRQRGIRANRQSGPVLPRLIASLDIGGSKDPSVLLVLRVAPPDPIIPPNDPDFLPSYTLECAVPAPLGLSYEKMSEVFSGYINQPEMSGALAVLDRTGLGRPVFEMISKRVENLIGITFTSGRDGARGGRFWTVPKLDAVSALQLALPRVQVPALAQGAAYVRRQLEDFGETRSKSGQSKFGNVTQGAHDDAVTGLMMAVMVGDWQWKAQIGLVGCRPSSGPRQSRPRR